MVEKLVKKDEQKQVPQAGKEKPVQAVPAAFAGMKQEKAQLPQEEQRKLNVQLIESCGQLKLEGARDALAKGADANTRTEDGYTPLILAVGQTFDIEKKPDIVRILIENHADVNARTNDGATVLPIAVIAQDIKLVKLLIEKGGDVNAQDENGFAALRMAILTGNTEIARLLIENGANVNVRTEGGATDLMASAYARNYELAKLLLEKGADANARTDENESVLMYANGDQRMFDLLLRYGARISNGEVRKIESSV